MKRLITMCLVCVLTTAAWGNAIITVDFNENGDGYYSSGGGVSYPLLHTMFEGSPSGLGYYGFPWAPEAMVPGDVLITESVGTNPVISDVLYFTTMGWYGGGQDYLYATVFVFSDSEAGEKGDLADTGFIPDPPYSGNAVTLLEEGTENGWNGVHYTPMENEPGYVPGQNVTYAFTSDVPEPATVALLGLGALSLIRKKRA
jgi:hypothetical protein